MAIFNYYSSANSYIAPYSSATDGGELISEFNQRIPLNVIGWKTQDISKADPPLPADSQGETTFDAWMTGCRDQEALKLSIVNSNLRVAPGLALVYGYFCHCKEEVLIPTVEAISLSEMGQNRPDDYVRTKYVKLRMTFTQPTYNTHDERLVPPTGDDYPSLSIVIDDTLPQLNELLLGVLGRDVNGTFTVVNNSLKTRFIGIEHIAGAENYDNLVSVPDDDDNIYGVKLGGTDESGNVTNLININEWTWLAYNSVLGRYLRNMAKVPDDAGAPGGNKGATNLQMLSSMIGWATSAGTPGGSESGQAYNKLIRLVESDNRFQDRAKPFLTYRVLKDGQDSPDCYDIEYVSLPFARYNGMADRDDLPPLFGRYSGIVTPETLFQVDTMWADRDSMVNGTQYGPFLTWQDAMATLYPKKASIKNGDYFWALNDSIDVNVNLGVFSSTFTTATSSTLEITFDDLEVTGATAGRATGSVTDTTLTEQNTHVVYDVAGTINIDGLAFDGKMTFQAQTEQIPVTTEGNGTATFTPQSFTQNVSARYVYFDKRADGTDYPPDTPWEAHWRKQAVLRGFACPATPDYYGFVKPSNDTNKDSLVANDIGNVVSDSETHRLRLDTVGRELLVNGGWKLITPGTSADYPNPCRVSPATADSIFAKLEGAKFTETFTIILEGDGWGADDLPALRRLRGDIVLDLTGVRSSDVPAVWVEDVNHLTLVAQSGSCQINVRDCVVGIPNSGHIYRWVSSQFESGSNVAVTNNPWVTLKNAFSNGSYVNSLQTRIVSFTRGEYDIESAEMDIWIKRGDFTKPESIEDFTMTSLDKLKFPPLYFRITDGNPTDIELIPESLNAKISGTGGTHRTWSETYGYVITGNWISTIDWENGEELSVNARMLSPASDKLHGIYDLRFRALIQFTHADDMLEESIDYSSIFSS